MTYTFALSRRSLPMRCLCVLLCVLVLWCFFMVPRASAVVAEAEIAYWGGAIVVSVLAAGGMALATGDAQKVGSAMYAALKDTGGKAWDSIQAMAAWAASAGNKVKDAAFRVGKDVWQAIADCFNKSYSDGYFSSVSDVSSGAVSTISSFVSSHPNSSFWMRFPYADKLYSWRESYFDDYYANYFFDFSFSDTIFSFKITRFVTTGVVVSSGASSHNFQNGEFFTGQYMWRVVNVNDRNVLQLGACYSSSGGYDWAWTDVIYSVDNLDLKYIGLSEPASVAIPQPDLKYPGDDYLVKAPDLPAVDTATGAVSWPSDAVYNKDAIALPYLIDAAGQKVADIPYDVPVDQTTGKTLDDADIGTDTKPGEDTDAGASTAGLIGSIIELLKNFFDSPSDFKLNFDGFKNLILPDRFPFSIPFDMVKAVKLFAAAAADFVFRIDLDTQYFSVHHTVDLTPYAVPIAFFRYACVFWFAWILISRTHDLIKW